MRAVSTLDGAATGLVRSGDAPSSEPPWRSPSWHNYLAAWRRLRAYLSGEACQSPTLHATWERENAQSDGHGGGPPEGAGDLLA